MTIQELTLSSFRNYKNCSVVFSPGVNLIHGDNAQGKTNLLEAVGYLSGAHSHRTRSDRELISFDQTESVLKAELESRNRIFQIEAQLHRGQRRKLFLNGIRLKTASGLNEVLRTVLFCPEDLFLIREGASARRRFLDSSLCQLRPRYAAALAEYNRLIDHKTRILKDWEQKPSLLETLDAFNDRLARTGAILIHYRAQFTRKLCERAIPIQQDFSGGKETLSLTYQTVSTVSDPLIPTREIYPLLLEHQASHRKAEIESRSCLSGPHKDDLIVEIDGSSARQFASQGQTRTAVLSLKLAEREVHFDDLGEWPVLLLDDVLSELDQRRQEFVLQRIIGGQVFITCCEGDRAPYTNGKSFHVQSGSILTE